ncbi:MAG TPA: tetratricopeptide repeat protein [Terriglobales bacterium]|nr:tetratricopeptide repeat protein [Terriglobales bacterium]
MRTKLLALALTLALCGVIAPKPATAEDKGIIALQQAVSLLISQVTDLQKNLNTQFGMLQGLVTQNTDTVNKLTSALDGIQRALSGNQMVANQQANDVSKQFQSLADSISDLQARLKTMDDTLKQVQQLQQTIPAPPGGASAVSAGGTGAPGMVAPAAAPANALQAYQNALSDFEASNPAAQAELAAFLRTYPDDPQVPDATYYLASIFFNNKQYPEAIDAYTRLIEQYPNSPKAGPAELYKGIALAKEGNRGAAISEFRAVVKNYSGTEAARQADSELRALNASSGRGR